MTKSNVTTAIAKTSVRMLAAGILVAAGVLTVSVAVPVVASSSAFARPPGLPKIGKQVKGRVSRGSVRRACNSVKGVSKGTLKGMTGGYSCANTKTHSWIVCNKWGECVGSTGKKKKRD